jgi:hypothetical protein
MEQGKLPVGEGRDVYLDDACTGLQTSLKGPKRVWGMGVLPPGGAMDE